MPLQAEEYKESFDDIFRRSSMPREPSFYVNVPSRMYVLSFAMFPAPDVRVVIPRQRQTAKTHSRFSCQSDTCFYLITESPEIGLDWWTRRGHR